MMADSLLDGVWRASWQATLLFVVVVIFVKLTPRISSAIHCWAYRLVCAKLLLALAIAPMIEVAVLPASRSLDGIELASNALEVGSDVDAASLVTTNAASRSQINADIVPMKLDTAAMGNEANVSEKSFWNSALKMLSLKSFSLWHAALVLWLIGIGWQVIRLSLRVKELNRLKASAQDLSESQVGKMLRREAIEMQVPVCPSIRSLKTAECPAVLGLRFPTIVLPESIVDEFSDQELRLLLRHELAHIRRRDLTWNWLATVTRTIFFFHPVVSFTLREWRVHQESACDELAIGDQPECSAAYANLLLHVAVSKQPLALTPSAVGIFESFETLKRRIEKMADFGTTSQRRQVLAIATAFLLAIIGLTPWKPIAGNDVFAVELMAATSTVTDNQPKAKRASTTVDGLKIRVVETKDVSGEKAGFRSDFSKMNQPSTFTSDSSSSEESTNTANGQSKASGSGFAAGGGSGGGAVVKFAGEPQIGIALQVEGGKGQRMSLVDEMIGVSMDGKTHKSLPKSGVVTRTVPAFEADHKKGLVAYFTNGINSVKQFKTLSGTLLVENVDTDEVVFQTLRTNARQKTKLGEYRITKSQKTAGGIQVAVQTPIPMSLRPALQMNRMNRMSAESAQKRFAAQRTLRGLTVVSFVDSEGLEYRPNSIGTHGSGSTFQSTTRPTNAKGSSVSQSGGGSSRKPGTQEKMYGLAQIPPGVDIVGIVIRVSDVPTSSRTLKFQLKDVRL